MQCGDQPIVAVASRLYVQALLEWLEPLVSRATRLWHTALCGIAASCCAVFILHIVVEEMGGYAVGIGKVRLSSNLCPWLLW